MKKKILWLCNHCFSDAPDSQSGTWLGAMGKSLAANGEYSLFNITQTVGGCFEESRVSGIVQWTVPWQRKLDSKGLPEKKVVDWIVNKIHEIDPDIIHVWGTECYWGMITAMYQFNAKVLIDVQGIRFAIAKPYMGGLSPMEIIKCHGLKELLRPSASILYKQRSFEKALKEERFILSNHDYVSFQSEWSKAHLNFLNPSAALFRTYRMLRQEFYLASKWLPPKGAVRHIFVSTSADVPYKGLHVIFKALSILKSQYGYGENIILNVAGTIPPQGIRRGGYAKWLDGLIAKQGISRNIVFHGALDALGLIELMHKCSVAVFPSCIESYGLALAEAQYIGLPSVVSYAGAMPELTGDGASALYFQPGDDIVCAERINRILNDAEQALRISNQAALIAAKRNDPERAVRRQKEIYRAVMDD